jgi:hypothetical protein
MLFEEVKPPSLVARTLCRAGGGQSANRRSTRQHVGGGGGQLLVESLFKTAELDFCDAGEDVHSGSSGNEI